MHFNIRAFFLILNLNENLNIKISNTFWLILELFTKTFNLDKFILGSKTFQCLQTEDLKLKYPAIFKVTALFKDSHDVIKFL